MSGYNENLPPPRRCCHIPFQILIFTLVAVSKAGFSLESQYPGKTIYEFYCYQCHGYAGDGKTLAATYLSPRPRDFTRTRPEKLTREAMLSAVTQGRPGSAMTAFSAVLSTSEIIAVVDYIRRRFMTGTAPDLRYHTAANGWSEHKRYAHAFPFATGELALDLPWEALNNEQRRGKQLYMNACISCHDRGRVQDEGPVWEPRAVSYPRNAYSHKSSFKEQVDGVSGASVYASHEIPPQLPDLSPQQRRGERLFQDNCAFCHAADASGRNWIGSFLQRRPRNLNDPSAMAGKSREQVRKVIREGLPGTSMPAWKMVLGEQDLEAILAYIEQAFYPLSTNTFDITNRTPREISPAASPPVWQRQRQ